MLNCAFAVHIGLKYVFSRSGSYDNFLISFLLYAGFVTNIKRAEFQSLNFLNFNSLIFAAVRCLRYLNRHKRK